MPEHQRQRAEKRGHRCHHNRPETQQAGFADGRPRIQPLLALGLNGKVDHHDGVFLDDADQQDDADQGYDAEFSTESEQRQQCADASRRQRRQDRQRMHEAFVEHAEDNIDGDQRRKNQQRLIGERALKHSRRTLETAHQRGRRAELLHGLFDGRGGLRQRSAGGQVERNRRGHELPLMMDRERRRRHFPARKGGERNQRRYGRLAGFARLIRL